MSRLRQLLGWRPFYDRHSQQWRYVKQRKLPLSVRFRRAVSRLRALPTMIRRDREAWRVFAEWYYEADRREAFGGDVGSVTAENYILREMYHAAIHEASTRARILKALGEAAEEAGGRAFNEEPRRYRWQDVLDKAAYLGRVYGGGDGWTHDPTLVGLGDGR